MMRPLLVALVAAAGLIGGAHGFKALHVMQPLQAKGGEQTTIDLQPKLLACSVKKCDLGFAGVNIDIELGDHESKTLMPVDLVIPAGDKDGDKDEAVSMASIHFSGDGPSLKSIKDFLVDALTGEVASSFCANAKKTCQIKAENDGEFFLSQFQILLTDKEKLKTNSECMLKVGCDKDQITSTLAQKLDQQREPARKILDGLQILAGDTNISPAKCKAKQLPHLTASTDLTGDIAKALDEISCFNSKESCPQKWNVYMANALVGKKRTGYSLMNTQIFKSESGKPSYEFDGTLVAVKKEYETRSGFQVQGIQDKDFRKGDAATIRTEIKGVQVEDAFTFHFTDKFKKVVDVDRVTTGSVFLDHAVMEFKIWNHNFVVLNVASVIDVKHKEWGSKKGFYQWFDHELIDGIITMKELDQKLYECQKNRLKELYDNVGGGLSDGAKQSLKKVFEGANATEFNGMVTLKKDDNSFLNKKANEKDIELVGDKLVEGMADFFNHVAGTCAESPASSYFNAKSGTAKEAVCTPGNMDAIISAWKAAAKKITKAKDILKFTGEKLAKIGFGQPYGGFGDAVAKLKTPQERALVSPQEIYNIIRTIAKKGKVIVGSEISAKRINPPAPATAAAAAAEPAAH